MQENVKELYDARSASYNSEPCYWCKAPIQNPEFWPCCSDKSCLAHTLRWFLEKLGALPEFPDFSYVLDMRVYNFVLALGRTEKGTGEIIFIVPKAARRIPLRMLEGDKRKVIQWCLETYTGKPHEAVLPKYIQYQIQQRLKRTKDLQSARKLIESFNPEPHVQKIKKAINRLEITEGIGN